MNLLEIWHRNIQTFLAARQTEDGDIFEIVSAVAKNLSVRMTCNTEVRARFTFKKKHNYNLYNYKLLTINKTESGQNLNL